MTRKLIAVLLDWDRRHPGGAWEGTGQRLTGNAAILAAHGKARASGWKCRRLEGGCPSQGCARGIDWERRHLGGA